MSGQALAVGWPEAEPEPVLLPQSPGPRTWHGGGKEELGGGARAQMPVSGLAWGQVAGLLGKAPERKSRWPEH